MIMVVMTNVANPTGLVAKNGRQESNSVSRSFALFLNFLFHYRALRTTTLHFTNLHVTSGDAEALRACLQCVGCDISGLRKPTPEIGLPHTRSCSTIIV